jgi:hypothetical protein
MNLGTYGILIAFGIFVLILIFNPRISCFGKRIRSPFYPLFRKKGKKAAQPPRTEDYGFHLVDGEPRKAGTEGANTKAGETKTKAKKTDDYGFRLD